MATRQVVQWEPSPGRGADVVANMAEAKKIHERLGWRVRAWQTIAAGAVGPRISYVLESDNLAAFFGTLDKASRDADWAAFIQRVLQSPTPSAKQVSNSVATEIAGLESGPLTAAPGTMIASAFQFQVKPGRMPDAIKNWAEGKQLAEAMGATVSVSVANYAGPAAGVVSVVFLFKTVADMASYQTKAVGNAKWQALLQRGQESDSPATVLSSALISEIPI